MKTRISSILSPITKIRFKAFSTVASDSAASLAKPCNEVPCSSLNEATTLVKDSFVSQQPLLLRGAVASAPAIHLWTSWSYLRSKVDADTVVQVEIGGSYSASSGGDVSVTNITFGDYMMYMELFEEQHGRHIDEEGKKAPLQEQLVYLAQNDLVKSLESDFKIPPFCNELGNGSQYSSMMWIGPHGCVSPLHFDPLDNAFMHFVGRKKVHLYPAGLDVGAALDGNQSNTSPLDPENPEPMQRRHPTLMELPAPYSCVLNAGDLLYIPKKWWHHVRTVETSFSVNIWWR